MKALPVTLRKMRPYIQSINLIGPIFTGRAASCKRRFAAPSPVWGPFNRRFRRECRLEWINPPI
jgi:hypothetical protein